MRIRNVAIIAHVDHGKTTLVDAFLKQTGVFRENQQVTERILDSNALERERGITILAKNTSVFFRDHKINIVDTPGHADFGGEVERILSMVDGALLLVDAVEGPMPQTRFVLQKALEHRLSLVVVVNKVDRPFSDPDRVADQLLDLLISLGADDETLDFPVYYCSALRGIAALELDALNAQGDVYPILEGVIEYVPSPQIVDGPLQVLVTNLDYDEYLGRIALGRLRSGRIYQGQEVLVTRSGSDAARRQKINQLFTFEGLKRVLVQSISPGDILAISGLQDVTIGDTINQLEHPCPLPSIEVDEPTLTMLFRVNDSPFAGREGRYLTSRHLRDRLHREVRTNVALRVEDTDSPDRFQVSGRGELHLSVLMETMRREGYEFCVSKPEPILKKTMHGVEEPLENLIIDVPQDYLGPVMEMVGQRRGVVTNMHQIAQDQLRVEFFVPVRGLIGFASVFLTETKGYGTMHHTFAHYAPWLGDIPKRENGSLVAWEAGEATAYALHNIEQRGVLFISPGTLVYAGMVVGENSRHEDLAVNVAKKKHMTNIRAAGSDDLVKLAPPRHMTLEQCVAYLAGDEYLEVTPKSLRIRKAVMDRHIRERLRKAQVQLGELGS